jgi:GDSL-like Lipase/Acylhydrolase family/Secretion system C-terminal sorting domain/Fibronectin type III domain
MKNLVLAFGLVLAMPILLVAQPQAPTNLTASTLSATSIVLNWTDASTNETGFQIERSLTDGSGFSLVATTAANTTTYISAGLTSGKQYFYRIRSTNGAGSSGYATVVTATTGLRRFLIDFGSSTTQTAANWNNVTVPTTGTTVNLIETTGTSSSLTIQVAKDPSNGYGAFSANGSNIVVLDYPVSAASDGHYGWQSGGSYKLNGLDNNKAYSLRMFGSRLYVGDARRSVYTINGQQLMLDATNNTTQTVQFQNIVPTAGSITINFTVASGSAFGYLNVLDIVEMSLAPPVPPTLPPAAPGNTFAEVVSSNHIDLQWTDNSDNETGFQIERSLTPGSGYSLISTTSANTTSYSNTGLKYNTKYYYRIRAINSGGASTYTGEVTGTTYQTLPAAPTALASIAISIGQVNLTWNDASDNETEFAIERSLTGGADFELMATMPSNTTSYSDTNVSPVTTYYYRLSAANIIGNSPYSTVSTATTPILPPASPLSLTATATSFSEIALSWIDNSDNESSFLIQRSLTSGNSFVTIATVDADQLSYTDNLLNSTTAYYYRVAATNAGGSSQFTEEASAVTLEGPPATPLALIATTISSNEIGLSWIDNSSNETGFEIQRSLSSEEGFVPVGSSGPNNSEWSDTTLAPITKYYYRVHAFNSSGSSSYINTSATTLPLPPNTPMALAAKAFSSKQIDLLWFDASDNETGFQIERSSQTDTGFTLIATLPPNSGSYSDVNLPEKTQFFYKIRALNAGGQSPYSGEASATTLAAPPVAPATLLATSTSTSQINLSWSDVSNNETGFQIEKSITAGTGYALLATVAANTTSYSDIGMAENTRYYYRVRSVNEVGSSSYSLEANALTQSTTQPYGTIFSETSFASATRFPIAGTGISRGANKLTMSGNPTLFSSYIYHDDAASPFRYTCLENWKVRARVKTPSSLNSTTYGIGLGVQNTNTADPYSSTMRWSWETGGNQVYLYYKSSISLQMVSSTKYVPAANTYYWVEVTRAKDSFTYTIYDGTNGTTQLFTAKLTFPTFTSGNYVKAHNTGQFVIHQFGGANEVTNWDVSTTALKNADFLGLGDSNMHGMFATNNASRWIESAMTTAGKTFNILAGISDRTSDVIKRLPEVIALKPKVVVLSIGRNDLAGSVSLTTVQNNIDNIINTLQNNGITVYLAGVIASNVNVSSLQTYYNNKPNVKVNAYTATKSASATTLNTSLSSGDAIHLNQAGNTALANLLLTIILPQTPPVAPGNLTATATSSSQINLAWIDNSNNETGFQIERSTTAGSGYTLVATTAANTGSYSNTGLTSNTQYYYRVRAINVSSNSSYTNDASATTPIVIIPSPTAPTNLSAVAASATQVNLTWTDASNNETGFQIERSLTSGSGFALVATITSNSTTYSDLNLVASTTYYYRVRAINDGGNSPYTSTANVTTQSGAVNPGGRRFLIDFGSPSTQTSATGWNNITSPTTGSVTNLIQSTGVGSTLSFQIVKDPSNGYGAFSTNGASVVVLDYPVSAVTDGHFGWGSGGTYRINGLDNSKVYSLRVFGSRMYVGDSRKGVFTINGVQQTLETTNNTSQTIVFTNVAPSAGSITMAFTVASGSQFAYINVLDITESAATNGRRITNEPVATSEPIEALEIKMGLSVSPNPATNELNVIVHDNNMSEVQLQLIDIVGKKLFSASTTTNKAVRFDLSYLPKGVYILHSNNAGASEWVRVIVE